MCRELGDVCDCEFGMDARSGVHGKDAQVSRSTWTGVYWKVDGEHSWKDVYTVLQEHIK